MDYQDMLLACCGGSNTRLPHWPIDVYLVAVGDTPVLYNGLVHAQFEPSLEELNATNWSVVASGGGNW